MFRICSSSIFSEPWHTNDCPCVRSGVRIGGRHFRAICSASSLVFYFEDLRHEEALLRFFQGLADEEDEVVALGDPHRVDLLRALIRQAHAGFALLLDEFEKTFELFL